MFFNQRSISCGDSPCPKRRQRWKTSHEYLHKIPVDHFTSSTQPPTNTSRQFYLSLCISFQAAFFEHIPWKPTSVRNSSLTHIDLDIDNTPLYCIGIVFILCLAVPVSHIDRATGNALCWWTRRSRSMRRRTPLPRPFWCRDILSCTALWIVQCLFYLIGLNNFISPTWSSSPNPWAEKNN